MNINKKIKITNKYIIFLKEIINYFINKKNPS